MHKLILSLLFITSSTFPQLSEELLLGHFGQVMPQAVFLQNKIAYLCDGTVSRTIDYSDPANPVNLDELNLKSSYRDICIKDNRAYVFGDDLVIIDCTNPASLNVLKNFALKAQIFKFAEDRILLADAKGTESIQLTAVQITSNLDMEVLNQLEIKVSSMRGNQVEDLEYNGKFIYLTAGGDIYCISADFVNYKILRNDNYVFSKIALRDHYLFATHWGKFVVFNAAADSLEEIKSIEIYYGLEDILLKDNRAYIINKTTGIYIVDISNISNPVEVGGYSSPNISGLFIDDRSVGWLLHTYNGDEYRAPTSGPIEIIDASTIWPALITKIDVCGPYRQICVYNNYVIASSTNSNKAAVINFNDYKKPQLVRFLSASHIIQFLFIHDHLLYISSLSSDRLKGSLEIFNVINPEDPVRVSKLDIDGFCGQLVVKKNYCYLSGKNGVHIIDVSDIYKPSIAADYISENGAVKNIAVNENILILNNFYPHNIEVVNISNPFLPTKISSSEHSYLDICDIQISFPYLYIYDNYFEEKLAIFNMENSHNLTWENLVGGYSFDYRNSYYLKPQLFNIILQNELIYLTNHEGINILDARDYNNIKLLARIDVPAAVSMQFIDDKIYTIGILSGIYLFRGYNPVSVENNDNRIMDYVLNQNYPNPFNSSTNISYNVKTGGQVLIRVYNTLGQLIATPINEYQSAGEHSIKFDASEYPSGVYIYNFSSGDVNISRKMVLMK